MSKKLLVLALVAALAVALVSPADAKKKRKKKKKAPKPYVSEVVTIHAGHPAFHSATEGNMASVTAQDFFNSCAVPSSNGVDAAVFEVPAAYQKIDAQVEAIGAGGPAGWDLDIYMYDSSCNEVGYFNSAGTELSESNETGLLYKGTAFVLVHNYLGVETDAHIELRPLK